MEEKNKVVDAVFAHAPVGTLLRRIIDKALCNNKPMFPIGFIFRADIDPNLLAVTVGRRRHIIEKVQALHRAESSSSQLSYQSECTNYTTVIEGKPVCAFFQYFFFLAQCVNGENGSSATAFADRQMQIEISSELFPRAESGRLMLPFGLPSQLSVRAVNDQTILTDISLIRFTARQLPPELSEQELVSIGEALFRNHEHNPLSVFLSNLVAATAVFRTFAGVQRPLQLGFLISSNRYGSKLNVEVMSRASLERYIASNTPNQEFVRRDDFNTIRMTHAEFYTQNIFYVSKRRGSCDFGVVPYEERPLQLQVMVDLLRGRVRPHSGRPAGHLLYLVSGRPQNGRTAGKTTFTIFTTITTSTTNSSSANLVDFFLEVCSTDEVMFCATMSIFFVFYKKVIPGDEFLFQEAIYQELMTLYRRHCPQLQLLYWRYFGLPHLQYRKSGDCSLQLLREGEAPIEDYNRAESNDDHSAGIASYHANCPLSPTDEILLKVLTSAFNECELCYGAFGTFEGVSTTAEEEEDRALVLKTKVVLPPNPAEFAEDYSDLEMVEKVEQTAEREASEEESGQ
ncbi:hypothetical protein TYRP_020820, partial [Tyrophagus putrescentiae]